MVVQQIQSNYINIFALATAFNLHAKILSVIGVDVLELQSECGAQGAH